MKDLMPYYRKFARPARRVSFQFWVLLIVATVASPCARAQDYLEANSLGVSNGANMTGGASSIFGTITVNGNAFLEDPDFPFVYYGYEWAPELGGFMLPYNGIVNGDDVSFNTLSVSGDVVSGGDFVVNGNLSFGPWFDGTDYWDGLSIVYDSNNGGSPVRMVGASPQSLWQWQENGAASPVNQMSLDQRGTLTLTDPVSGNTMALNPSNLTTTVTIGGNATSFNLLNYTANTSMADFSMAGLSLYSASGIGPGSGTLPELYVGDNLYPGGNNLSPQHSLSIGNPPEYSYPPDVTLDYGNQTITYAAGRTLAVGANATLTMGDAALTIGDYASAEGTEAAALGGNATANGANALAFMDGNATGNLAIAIDGQAVGDNTVALGGGNASANGAMAIGFDATASAENALALGVGTSTQTWGTVVVGHYNTIISGNVTTWVSSAPAFIVGVGSGDASRSNAFIMLNDGTVIISGAAAFANSTTSQALQVNGASTLNGSTNFGGEVTVSTVQGDIPQGPYDGTNAH